MGRKGAAGGAWLSRRRAGGHLPADSALRPGWGGVGVCPLSLIALRDAGPDNKLSSQAAGAAGSAAESSP